MTVLFRAIWYWVDWIASFLLFTVYFCCHFTVGGGKSRSWFGHLMSIFFFSKTASYAMTYCRLNPHYHRLFILSWSLQCSLTLFWNKLWNVFLLTCCQVCAIYVLNYFADSRANMSVLFSLEPQRKSKCQHTVCQHETWQHPKCICFVQEIYLKLLCLPTIHSNNSPSWLHSTFSVPACQFTLTQLIKRKCIYKILWALLGLS